MGCAWVAVPGFKSDVYDFVGVTDLAREYGRSSDSTPANSNNRNLIYLDRHNVDCGARPLARWRGDNYHWNFRFLYECASVTAYPSYSNTRYSGRNEGHSLIYLDRFAMFCGHNELMTGFHCQNDGGQPNFKYICKSYPMQSLSCSNHQTGYIDAANKEILYMDRYDVNCPSGQALQGWRGSGGWPNLRIDYTCCTLDYTPPTAYPVANPTNVPISNPTNVPISDPTEQPVAEPTAAPTLPKPISCAKGTKADLGIIPKPGCAAFADKDIGWSKASSSEAITGVMSCTIDEMTLDSSDNLFNAVAEKGISYIKVGRGVSVQYTTKDDKKGVYDRLHREVVHTENDQIASVVIKSEGVDSIPTSCDDM